MPLNGLGLVLGGVGLILAVVRKGTGIGYSIAGTAVNSIGLLLGFIYIFFIASAFQLVDEAMDDIAAKNTPKQAQAVDSTQPASTQPTPTGSAWTKADIPLQLGSIQLRITEVVIGKVPLINFSNDETSSQNELLALRVKVTNTNERKKVDYQGWMSDYASLLEIDAELTDDAGNRYRAIDFGLRKVKDAETQDVNLSR